MKKKRAVISAEKRDSKVKFDLAKNQETENNFEVIKAVKQKLQEKGETISSNQLDKPLKSLLKKKNESVVNETKNGKKQILPKEKETKKKLQLNLDASEDENSEDDIAKHIFSDDSGDEEITDDFGIVEENQSEDEEEFDEESDDEDLEEEDEEEEEMDEDEDEEDEDEDVQSEAKKLTNAGSEEDDEEEENEEEEMEDENEEKEDDLKINLAFGASQGEDLQIINQRIQDLVSILSDFQNKKEETK